MDRCLNLIPGSGILDGDHLGKKWRDCNSGLWAAETLDTCQTMALNDKNRKKCLVLVLGSIRLIWLRCYIEICVWYKEMKVTSVLKKKKTLKTGIYFFFII